MSSTVGDTRSERTDKRSATPSWADDRWRSGADLVVFAAVGAAFWWVAGVPGVAVTVLLALAWVVLPNVAVFVIGQFAVVALVPSEAALASTALPMVALGGLLVTTTITGSRLRDALAVVVSLALVGAVAAVTYGLTGILWLAVLGVLLASAVGFVSLDLIALSEFGETDES
ncbi:hypothetical protein [Halosimplex pelagicum]|uniref:DUF8163 domain-containing protein n=1 Tax=Halosimplex pelagicum TaxID=869886 RepID=A0A7D5TAF7_9EURY|nr:hypothetical protein [Halosimplex pelagicum]QLH81349.1 hypothetical protein HZS54_06795 [Halosimplex pelagicum]